MARPTKPLISRDLAVQEAIALIDTEGLEAFSLPRLAARLGVRAPSLYHHFSDKHELLTEVSKAILQEAPVPPFTADQTWQEWCIGLSLDARRTILRHRNAAPLIVQYLPRDTLTGLYERSTSYLTERGVPLADQILIMDGLERLAIGAATMEAMRDPISRIKVFPKVDPRLHPSLRKALRANRRTPEQLFEDSLRAFLAGVDTLASD